MIIRMMWIITIVITMITINVTKKLIMVTKITIVISKKENKNKHYEIMIIFIYKRNDNDKKR